MAPTEETESSSWLHQEQHDPLQPRQPVAEMNFRLSRWLVYFGSGPGWYPVGEFVAADATSAIERAIDIFGCGAGYRAEEIPWDAAPLPRTNRSSRLSEE